MCVSYPPASTGERRKVHAIVEVPLTEVSRWLENSTVTDAFILSAARTPIGKFLGGLADSQRPAQLGALAVAEALIRAGAVPTAGRRSDPRQRPAGRRRPEPRPPGGPRRRACPTPSAPSPINKVCGSGLKAVMLAAQAIRRRRRRPGRRRRHGEHVQCALSPAAHTPSHRGSSSRSLRRDGPTRTHRSTCTGGSARACR